MHMRLATQAQSHASKMCRNTNGIHSKALISLEYLCEGSKPTTETTWMLQDQGDEMDQTVQRSDCTLKRMVRPEAKECVRHSSTVNKHSNSHRT